MLQATFNDQLRSPELHDPNRRRNSVLIFYGTGVSMWHYYPFLRQFSLEDLQEFYALYGISGGASALWCYGLSLMKLFDASQIINFDSELRSLNTGTVIHRIFRLLMNRYVYDTNKLAQRIESFASPSARRIKFSDYPLKNFTAIGFDPVNQEPLFFNARSHPELKMGDVMASLSCPRNLWRQRFCKPILYDGFEISDLDFAGRKVRRAVVADLKAKHKAQEIYICNLFFSKQSGNVTYIYCGHDRFTKLGQLYDSLLLFMNISNPRLYEVSF